MRKIVTFLWFNDQAKEAVDSYVSLFEDAKIINTSYLTESVAEAAGKQPGDISAIDFELNGQNFTMMRDPDTAKADRVGAAMLGMEKLDISELEKAYKGE